MDTILWIIFWLYAGGCLVACIFAIPFFLSGLYGQALMTIFLWPLEVIAYLRGAR